MSRFLFVRGLLKTVDWWLTRQRGASNPAWLPWILVLAGGVLVRDVLAWAVVILGVLVMRNVVVGVVIAIS